MANFIDERSMDGSTASTARPLTKDSKLMVVFDFLEHSPAQLQIFYIVVENIIDFL